eukprot:jgi/Psemu1/4636/gm1.4636_g
MFIIKKLFLDKPVFSQTAAFNDKIQCIANQCSTNNELPFVNITRGQFNRRLLCVVTHFVVMHPPLKHGSDILDSRLLIFNFLCIPHSNYEFHQHTHSACSYEAEALHIDQAICRTRHSATTLFVDMSQMANSNELTPSHNFLLFLCTLTKCGAQPCLFHSPRVQLWIKQSSPLHLYIHHCLLCILQKAILPFVVLLNAALSPKWFQLANSAFPNLIQLFEQAAYGNHLYSVTSAPSSFLWWPHHRTALLKMAACHKALTTQSDDVNSKRQLRHQPGTDRPTTQFHGAPPIPATHPTVTPTNKASLSSKVAPNALALMTPYVPIKPECASTTCKFFHATTWAQLSATGKKIGMAYVNTNPAVDFYNSSDLFYMLPLCSSIAQSSPGITLSCPVPPSAHTPRILSCEPVTLYPGTNLTLKHVPTNLASLPYISTPVDLTPSELTTFGSTLHPSAKSASDMLCGSFLHFLTHVCNLRISFPHYAILTMDNDACGYLGFAMGQSFCGCFCSTNRDPVVKARTQMARYSWCHKPAATLCAGSSYHTIFQAHLESIKRGVFENGDNIIQGIPCIRIPPAMPMQDVFGLDHPCQEQILSQDKLDLVYTKEPLLVGVIVNSWSMTICFLPRRHTTILFYVHKEACLLPRKMATISGLATLLFLLVDAFQHYPWGLCHIPVFCNILRNSISAAYHLAKRHVKTCPLPPHYGSLPANIQAHFTWPRIQDQEAFVWPHRTTVSIPFAAQHPLKVLVNYLTSGSVCSTPIGHLVSHDFTFNHNTSDASQSGIGACLPSLQIFCFLPYSSALYTWTNKFPHANPPYVHINTLEFLGVLLCFIIGQLWHSQDSAAYLPFPTLHTLCNHTVTIACWMKALTRPLLGCNVILLLASFWKDSPLGCAVDYIKGMTNTLAGSVSPPHKLPLPPHTLYHMHLYPSYHHYRLLRLEHWYQRCLYVPLRPNFDPDIGQQPSHRPGPSPAP